MSMVVRRSSNQVIQVVAVKFGQIVILALGCLTAETFAQHNNVSDDATSMTREQWRARIEAAKARIQEMRRDGISMAPLPNEEQTERDQLNRIFDDDTLVYGDIVVTKQGMFQFIGKPETPHNPEDFKALARDGQR